MDGPLWSLSTAGRPLGQPCKFCTDPDRVSTLNFVPNRLLSSSVSRQPTHRPLRNPWGDAAGGRRGTQRGTGSSYFLGASPVMSRQGVREQLPPGAPVEPSQGSAAQPKACGAPRQSPISILEAAWSPAPGTEPAAAGAPTPDAVLALPAHSNGSARSSRSGSLFSGSTSSRSHRPRPPLHNPGRCPSPARARSRARTRAAVSRSSSLNDEKVRLG